MSISPRVLGLLFILLVQHFPTPTTGDTSPKASEKAATTTARTIPSGEKSWHQLATQATLKYGQIYGEKLMQLRHQTPVKQIIEFLQKYYNDHVPPTVKVFISRALDGTTRIVSHLSTTGSFQIREIINIPGLSNTATDKPTSTTRGVPTPHDDEETAAKHTRRSGSAQQGEVPDSSDNEDTAAVKHSRKMDGDHKRGVSTPDDVDSSNEGNEESKTKAVTNDNKDKRGRNPPVQAKQRGGSGDQNQKKKEGAKPTEHAGETRKEPAQKHDKAGHPNQQTRGAEKTTEPREETTTSPKPDVGEKAEPSPKVSQKEKSRPDATSGRSEEHDHKSEVKAKSTVPTGRRGTESTQKPFKPEAEIGSVAPDVRQNDAMPTKPADRKEKENTKKSGKPQGEDGSGIHGAKNNDAMPNKAANEKEKETTPKPGHRQGEKDDEGRKAEPDTKGAKNHEGEHGGSRKPNELAERNENPQNSGEPKNAGYSAKHQAGETGGNTQTPNIREAKHHRNKHHSLASEDQVYDKGAKNNPTSGDKDMEKKANTKQPKNAMENQDPNQGVEPESGTREVKNHDGASKAGRSATSHEPAEGNENPHSSGEPQNAGYSTKHHAGEAGGNTQTPNERTAKHQGDKHDSLASVDRVHEKGTTNNPSSGGKGIEKKANTKQPKNAMENQDPNQGVEPESGTREVKNHDGASKAGRSATPNEPAKGNENPQNSGEPKNAGDSTKHHADAAGENTQTPNEFTGRFVRGKHHSLASMNRVHEKRATNNPSSGDKGIEKKANTKQPKNAIENQDPNQGVEPESGTREVKNHDSASKAGRSATSHEPAEGNENSHNSGEPKNAGYSTKHHAGEAGGNTQTPNERTAKHHGDKHDSLASVDHVHEKGTTNNPSSGDKGVEEKANTKQPKNAIENQDPNQGVEPESGTRELKNHDGASKAGRPATSNEPAEGNENPQNSGEPKNAGYSTKHHADAAGENTQTPNELNGRFVWGKHHSLASLHRVRVKEQGPQKPSTATGTEGISDKAAAI